MNMGRTFLCFCLDITGQTHLLPPPITAKYHFFLTRQTRAVRSSSSIKLTNIHRMNFFLPLSSCSSILRSTLTKQTKMAATQESARHNLAMFEMLTKTEASSRLVNVRQVLEESKNRTACIANLEVRHLLRRKRVSKLLHEHYSTLCFRQYELGSTFIKTEHPRFHIIA